MDDKLADMLDHLTELAEEFGAQRCPGLCNDESDAVDAQRKKILIMVEGLLNKGKAA